jgi:DNA uptake protein ComE-like DNA-binding protein
VNHQRYTDTRTVLTEIDQDPFGNLVLSAIQTHIQAKAPEDEVILLLNQILGGILEDQRAHDAINRTDQAACDRITVDLDNNINYHEAQIVSNTQLRDDSVIALAEAEDDVRQTVKDISDNEAVFAREEATRNNQHSIWARKDGELEELLIAIDEASKLVQHLQLGASFAQVKTRFDSVNKKLTALQSQEALLKPIIAALSEVASSTNVDFKSIAQIAELIAQLRQQLVGSRANLQDTETKQADNWAHFSGDLTEEHNRLQSRKDQLEATISLQKENIEIAEEYLEYHTLELENAQDGLAREEAWCAQQSETYDTQSGYRTNQIDLVQRIQEHVSEHLSAASQFLGGRKV